MPQVAYQWTAAGVDVVEQSFTRIDKAAERSAQKAVAEAAKAAKAKTAAAAKAAREAEQAAAKESAAAAKAAAAQATSANKAAASQAKARERVFQIRAKYDAQEAKNAARAAEQGARAQERALKHVADVRSRFFLQQQRQEEKAGLARKRETSRNWSPTSLTDRSSWRGVAGQAVGGIAMSAAALGLGTVGVAARQEFALRDEANRIAVMGHKPGEAFTDSGSIVSQLHATAMATPGVKSDELAAGMKEFVSLTGDLPLAQKHLVTLATAMQSMGTDAAGTAKIMVALKQSFGITGVQEMRDAMASLEAQAKASGMPMEALEGHILNMAAAGKRFGFTGAQGAQQVGGLMSMARQGIGDPEKAEKAAAHFLEKLQEQGSKLAAMGVTTVSKDGKQMKPLNEIVSGLITKVGGNNMRLKSQELLQLLGAGERGGAGVIGAPLATYQKTFNETQGTDAEKQKAATAAMTAELNKLMSTTATWDDTTANAAQMQQAASAQLDAAWETVRAKVGSDLVPAIAALVPSITGATGVLDPLIAASVALAEAFKATHDQFLEWGWIKPKPEDKIGNLSKAETKLKEFESTHQGLWAQEGENEQRTKLQKDVETAKDALFVKPSKLPGRGSDEDFAREFAMASGKEGAAYSSQKEEGIALAKQIHADPHMDTRFALSGFNDKQREAIEGRKEEEISVQSARAFDANAAALKAHQNQLDAAAAAAKRLADNLDQAGDSASRSQPLSDRN